VRVVRYEYSSDRYFDLSIERDSGIWTIQISVKRFSAQYIKDFAHNIKEPFKASPIV